MIRPDRIKGILSALRGTIQDSMRDGDETAAEATIDATVAELLLELSDAEQRDGFTRHASLVLRTFEEVGLPDTKPEIIGDVVQGIGKTYERLGDAPSAGDAYARALKLADDNGDELLAAGCRRGMGRIMTHAADLEAAEKLLRESLASYERMGDVLGTAQTLCNIGALLYRRGDVDAAEKAFNGALAHADDAGDPALTVSLRNSLGNIADTRGDTASAVEHYEAGAALAKRSGDETLLAEACINIGMIRGNAEDWAGANEMFEKSLELARNNGAGKWIAAAHLGKALVYVGIMDLPQATASCGKAMSIFSSTNDKLGQATCYRVLGDIFARRGESLSALKMLDQSITVTQLAGASLETAASLRTKGLIHERFGRNDEAAVCLRDAVAGFDSCGAMRDKSLAEADLARVSG